MKKVLFFLLSMWIFFACSEDKEIPTVDPPVVNPGTNDDPKPVEVDSIYYCTDMDGFELVAASKKGHSFYMQKDTTFAFKCMYDSCKTQSLVAYCDSTGMVERIVAENKVYNILYHEDLSKIDIFFEKDGKLEWRRDLENPYQEMSSRATEGDVPYSAISVQNRLSHAVYTIINDSKAFWHEDISKLVKGFAVTALSVQLRTEFMSVILGQNFDKTYLEKNWNTVLRVMNDYAGLVMTELYGNAIPVAHAWVERTQDDKVKIDYHTNDVDSLKTDFRIGLTIEYDGEIVDRPYYKHQCNLNAPEKEVHKKCEMFASGDKSFLTFTSKVLPTGRKYKYRAHLLPSASSKYLSDMKCLLDYRRWGRLDEFYLFEPKASVVSTNESKVTIDLTTVIDEFHDNFTMGVRYGTNPDLSRDYEVAKVDVSSLADGTGGSISKEIVLEGLIPQTTYYYIPFIQYDGNIANRPVANSIDAIYPEDRIFLGEKDSFKTIDEKSIRDLLREIYKKNNGANWKHQKNWMTDLPITEWEGVRRSEGKSRNADYLYHFEFMGMNNLTGTLTIENCNENIVLYNCDYANNKLEGLHLKNCPNLYFDNKIYQNGEDITPYWMESSLKFGTCYIGNISNNLKNIYIDNIGAIIVDRDKNLFYKAIVLSSNYDEKFPEKWEYLEIKNNKDIAGIVITNCSELKNVICENNTFVDTESYRDREYIIDNCPSLEKISFKYNTSNSEYRGIYHYVSKCHNLKEVILENPNDFTSYYLEFNSSQIDLVRIKNAAVYFRDQDNYLEDYEYPQIREIYVERDDSSNYAAFFYMDETVTQNIKLENLRIYSYVAGDLNFHNNQTIKNIEIMDHMSIDGIIDLNGCVNLERFECPAVSMYDTYTTIDVRNTPRLKEFICIRANVKEILFDSHMNDYDLFINCMGLNILQELPDCYEGGGNFLYNNRYVYIRKENGEFETIDHGRGWWYPGEPESLGHHRYN